MAIEYTVTDLEGLDETVKPLYKEAEGGGYVLDVAGVVPQSKFNEVNQKAVDNATEAQRRRNTNQRILSKLGLEDASALDETLDALLANKGGKSDTDHEAVVSQIKAQYQSQIDELKGSIKGTQTKAAQSALQAELQAAGFPAKAAEMFASANMNRVNIDDDGKTVIMSQQGTPLAGSGADGFATFADLSSELAAAMPEFLVDKGKGGGGKSPASGGGNAAPNGQFGTLAAKIPGFSDLPKN